MIDNPAAGLLSLSSRLRRLPWLPVAPLILAPFVLMAPAWLAGRAIFWGTPVLQFVPWLTWASTTLRSGHLPLWNPLSGMGAPLLANYQSALFYPPNWSLLLLGMVGGAPFLAWGQAILIALHLAWASLGMARLARGLGLGPPAQLVSGLAYGLSGYLVARAGFLSMTFSAAWLPWALAEIRVMASPRPERKISFLRLALILSLQLLAGHAQVSWYSLLLAGMWALFWGVVLRAPSPRGRDASGRHWLAPLALLAIAALLAACLAAAQLLPTGEYLLQSQREGGLEEGFALTYSFSPWRFLTLLAPDFFGNPARGNFTGYGNYWEDAVYIGLFPLLLAAGAVVSALRRTIADSEIHSAYWRPVVLFLAAITALSFLLALGKNTPIFPWLFRHVPTFGMFVGPTRFSLWAELSLALLAGFGVEGWRRPAGRSLYWSRLATAGAFAATGGALLASRFSTNVNPVQASAAALAGVWGFGAGMLHLLGPQKGKPAVVWTWGVVLLIAADLLAADWLLNPTAPIDLFRSSAEAISLRAQAGEGRIYLPSQDEYALKFERFFLFNTFQPGEGWTKLRQVLLPNTNLLDGLPSANNFDPLVPGRYDRWMKALAGGSPEIEARLLPRMGAGLVEKVDTNQASGVRFRPAISLGRARWVPCSLPARSAEEAWDLVSGEDRSLEWMPAQVVLEEMLTPPVSSCDVQQRGRAEITAENPNALSIRLSAPAGGWLLLADTWYPGWQAWVDGQPTPVLRADYLFRAVAVPTGDHVVEFRYRPASFYAGVGISLVTMMIFLLLFIWMEKQA